MTADALREKVLDYCRQYSVQPRADDDLPPFPAGKRETPQHRAWIVLYKARRRLDERQQRADPALHAAALEAQKGRCPICLAPLASDDPVLAGPAARITILHPACREAVRFAGRHDPSILDRIRAHAWPAPKE